jgi:hypothetical protein
MEMNLALVCVIAALIPMTTANVFAQGRGGGPPQPPRLAAPVDLTGYWVSLVTEDWRYRMTTPPKGDFESVPLNPEGEKLAKAWDPANDEASGNQCRAYGAGGLLRIPGRLHITWQDDNTLKVEADAGTQTRLFYFGAPQSQGGDWQGVSAASWDRSRSPMGFQFFGSSGSSGGSLAAVTTKLKPGYLRRNGVPYSANTVITEYWDRLDVPNGDSLLVVSGEIVDPTYLSQPFWTSTHFKKQNDGSGWHPTPCSAR